MSGSIELDIEGLEPDCLEEACPNCQLSGMVVILGTPHHVTLVKVEDCEKVIESSLPAGVDLPRYAGQVPIGGDTSQYDRLCDIDPGGNFRTIQVPGYPGEYVCIITPFHR